MIDLDARLPALHLVRTPPAARLASRALGAIVAVLPIGLLVTPWQQNVQGAGRVVALTPVERQQRVEAPIDGRVVRWHVREGTNLEPGQPIVEISDNDPELVGRLEQQRTAAAVRVEATLARVELNEAQVVSLDDARQLAVAAAQDRVKMAAERVSAAEQSLQAAEAGLKTARLNLDRQRALAGKGIASRRTLELAELDAERSRTEVDRAAAALRASKNEQSSLASERDRIEKEAIARVDAARAARQSAEGDLASARADLARAEVTASRQQAQTVRATAPSTVLRLEVAQGGEMVKAGDTLAILVPKTNARAAEIWVDGNDAALISDGRSVRLQFEGWPAVQFVGWPSVAKGTFGGRVSLVDATDDGQGRFRILVVPDGLEPWPEARFLRQGVRAKGWVLLEQVSLGFELWRQLNGFPPVASFGPPKGTPEKKGK